MSHGLVLVVGDRWEAELEPYSTHRQGSDEDEGRFDYFEVGGIFGKPLQLKASRPDSGLFRMFRRVTHVTQARRSEIDLTSLEKHFPFDLLYNGKWHEPQTFEEAKQTVERILGDPLLTAVDCHL